MDKPEGVNGVATAPTNEKALCRTCGHGRLRHCDFDMPGEDHSAECKKMHHEYKEASAHTPGPWRVLEPAGGWIQTEGNPYGRGSMHVADVRGWGHLTGRGGGCAFDEDKAFGIQMANARLIAAAPDLLAALKEAVTDEGSGWLVRARAAIAKAEGR